MQEQKQLEFEKSCIPYNFNAYKTKMDPEWTETVNEH